MPMTITYHLDLSIAVFSISVAVRLIWPPN